MTSPARRITGPTGTVIPPPSLRRPAPTPASPVPASLATNAARVPAGVARPLMDAMHASTEDLLTLASQLGLGATPSNAAVLRDHIERLLAQMRERAIASGVTAEDVSDAQFAIVALFDEILGHTSWPGRAEWRTSPLQLVWFRDNSAGETFFRRVHALLADLGRPHVLLVYFYCLGLGFQGRHAVNGGTELSYLYCGMANALDGYLVPPEPLSPHGIPPATDRSAPRRAAPLVRAGLLVAAVAMAAFLLLRLTLTVTVTNTTNHVRAQERAAQRRP